jgi:hypothetical protein
MPAAHRRLMDCHTQWHMLQEAYFDPHGFRLNLNSLLQNLRNVTWLLQKQKAELAGYNEWYPRFQESAGKDSLMRWSVRSRNRITKESDLELLSHMRVVWHQDWLQRVVGTSSSYPPRMSVREVVVDMMRRYRPPYGTMTVQRRWVDKALPEWELLDATGEVYAWLEALLAEAHSAAGVHLCNLESHEQECVTSALRATRTRPECMLLPKEDLQAHFDLVDGTEIEQITEPIEFAEELANQAAERYGMRFQLPAKAGPIEAVPTYMQAARVMMERDGHHGTFAFLYRGDRLVQLAALEFYNQGSKILAFERLASAVRALKVDGLVVIAEVWWAVQTEREKELGTVLFPARDRLDRNEALAVYAATRDGRFASQVAVVTREADGRTVCAEPAEDVDFAANTLAPIVRMWKEMELAEG